MIPRKRAWVNNQQITIGGSSAASGTVAIGPSYGQSAGNDDSTFDVQTVLDLVGVDLTGNLGVDVAVDLESINLDGNFGVQTTLTGTIQSAPFWQSVETAALSATADNIVCNIPAGIESGDLLLAFVGCNDTANDPDVDTPSGWTLVETVDVTTANLRCFRRIATGSEGASVTFTFTGIVANDAQNACAEIHRIIAVDNTTPVDVSATDIVEVADLQPDPSSPAVTTTVVNTLAFACLFHNHAVTESHTPPGSHTERTDFESDNVTIWGMTTAERVFAAADDTGTAQHDCTETAGTDGAMIRVAIAPAVLVIA